MSRVRHVLSFLVALLLCLSVGSTAASAALWRQDVHRHLLTRTDRASELGLAQTCKVGDFDSSSRKVIGCSPNPARGYDEIAIFAAHQNCGAATAGLLGIGSPFSSEFVSGLSLRAKSHGYDAAHLLRVSHVINATKALPDPVAEAQAAAAQIRAGGGKTPTMTSAAVDSSTGKVYTGTSGYNGPVPPEINLPNPSKTPWSAANCAEVAACSAAIADGAKLENLQVATVRTRTGVVAPPCPNCQAWVPGKKP